MPLYLYGEPLMADVSVRNRLFGLRRALRINETGRPSCILQSRCARFHSKIKEVENMSEMKKTC